MLIKTQQLPSVTVQLSTADADASSARLTWCDQLDSQMQMGDASEVSQCVHVSGAQREGFAAAGIAQPQGREQRAGTGWKQRYLGAAQCM
jgi:hypothetical protein